MWEAESDHSGGGIEMDGGTEGNQSGKKWKGPKEIKSTRGRGKGVQRVNNYGGMWKNGSLDWEGAPEQFLKLRVYLR